MKKHDDLKLKKIFSLEEKDEKFSFDELHFLYSMAKSKNDEFRVKAAELLVDQYTKDSEEILYHMTFDKEFLVRLNAIDSLCIGRMQKSLQRLQCLMCDKDPLIRGYAIMSYVDVTKNIYKTIFNEVLNELYNKLETEKNSWTKAIICRTLYVEGEKKCLNDLLDLYNKATCEKDFSIVWCLLHIFEEIIDENNQHIIKQVLIKEYNNVLDVQKEKIDELLQCVGL